LTKSNNKVYATKKATTNWGSYYQIVFDGGKTGWINSESATLKNPKLDQGSELC
jgi:beta-lactamase class C